MDLNLIRTFLEVCETRHFGRAAEHLHVTTSAVSARIKTLEDQLATPLFLRLRNGIEPTTTAQRLIPQFRSLMSTWDQVRSLTSAESAARPNLTVAASSGIWASTDTGWIRRLTETADNIRILLETNQPSDISRRLQQGVVDLGLTFEQLVGPQIVSRRIGELRLRLMSTKPQQTVHDALAGGYIHVEWGTSFNTRFLSALPDYVSAGITVSSVGIVPNLLRNMCGAAYLSDSVAQLLGSAVTMHPVGGAPVIPMPIFASSTSTTPKPDIVQAAVTLIGAFTPTTLTD